LLKAILYYLENGEMGILNFAKFGHVAPVTYFLDHLETLLGSSVLNDSLYDTRGIVLHRNLRKLPSKDIHKFVSHS